MEILLTIWQIFKNWWWLIAPLILYFLARFFYLWWIRWEVWYPKFNWILLELKPPKETLKPFKAMEDIFSLLWPIYDGPNWRERWCEGELPLGGGLWFSFEIVGMGGEIHFYMRIPEFFRNRAESAIYSRYPEAEISIVDDYTKNVPQDVPNEKWDLYGENITLIKPDSYPIKTYQQFFEERPEVVKEEKRIDPIDSLLESLSKLQPAEQVWLQIVCNAVTDKEIPWQTQGRAEVKRIGEEVSKRWFGEEKKPSIWETLITGKVPAAPPPVPAKPWPPGELMPKEQELIQGIENKIKKWGFQVWIRTIYLCKKEEPHFFGNYKIGRGYFSHFATEHLNGLIYWGATRTRVHYWMRDRRLYLRKRKQLKEYIQRFPPNFPWSFKGEFPFPHIFSIIGYRTAPGIRGTFILNIEELATILHFPAKIITPALPYVEAKKGGPPPTLPVE
ncbi:MAG: hypothetical protein QME61_01365 [Patescibacteria group bacterium]|nr:hypothetical protein [Patescibacteria group bacterium]